MPDTVAGTYATLAGVEIVNDARTYAYLRNGLGPSSLNIYGECACPNILEILDCPGQTEYIDPETDKAPWYSPNIPESAGFLGFITDSFMGLNSPFTRTVTETRNGGILTRSRLNARELEWRGFLFGATCCSVQYGLRWLAKTLARFDTSCRDCNGDDLELIVCCPEEGDTSSPLRLLKGVGLLEGPIIESERKVCTAGCSSGCGGSCIIEVTFTLVASQPYLYAPPVPIYDCVNIWEDAVTPYTLSTELEGEYPFYVPVDCGTPDCSENLFEAGIGALCPTPTLPPAPTYSNSCFDPITHFNFDPQFNYPLATYLSVPESHWNDLEEVVPVITIKTGPAIVPYIRIGFYESINEDPCASLSAYPPNCNVICDPIGIIAIPANSSFYIDGRTKKMAVICSDGTVYPGEKLTSGPWSWPAFTCFGFCMEIMYQTYNIQEAGYRDTCVSLSLVPRTF